ncbi:MAG TPA: GntR family transcriptional regulator [Burkholderiaceae bacterium]|nr:GntR family transcriptional regulator [Burkholderiaceae bacterium]
MGAVAHGSTKSSARIHLSVEARIRDGALLPGDPIDEEALMREFGVSRTPVREALLQLKAQGLLASLPRGGVVVAKMDVTQLFAMWELLADLEGLCARYACERMTRAERDALAALHRAAADIVERDDAIAWRGSNMAFHELLYAGARNPYLRQEILRMRTRTQAYRAHAFGALGRLRVSHEHHGRIVDAIAAHDPAAAARAGVGHLRPGEGMPSATDLIVTLPRELLA